MPKKRTVSIRVDPELWKEFKKYAIDRGMTVSTLIENFIRNTLEESHHRGRRTQK